MYDNHLQSFIADLESKLYQDAAGLSTYDWINRNTTLNGKPFTCDRYPFQKDILNDTGNRLVVKKISQVGLTEIQMRKMACFLMLNPHTQGIFSLPDKNLMKRFSQTRLLPMINEDAVFNRVAGGGKPTRNVDLIQFMRSFLNIVIGSESSATSITGDILAVDEVDLTSPEVLALFDSRLQNSDFGIRYDFSTPTYTDFGIDGLYKVSDQREYMLKCDSCGHWQVPDFTWDFVRIDGLKNAGDFPIEELDLTKLDTIELHKDSWLACEKCGEELNLSEKDGAQREWVAQEAGRSSYAHGYQVRPFSSNRLSISYIIQRLLTYRNQDFLRGWYNTVLGRDYADASARIQESDIRACLMSADTALVKGDSIWVGIDVGIDCHIVIGKADKSSSVKVLKFDICPASGLKQYVKALQENYSISGGLIDRYPNTTLSQEIAEITKGTILPCEYGQSGNIEEKIDLVTFEQSYLRVNRTWALDYVAKIVRNHWVEFYGYLEFKPKIIDHLRNMIRVEIPEKLAKWEKLNTEDHFFHALNYMVTSIRYREWKYGIDLLSGDNRGCVDFGVIEGVGKSLGMTDIYGSIMDGKASDYAPMFGLDNYNF